jgi:hypothetical protein
LIDFVGETETGKVYEEKVLLTFEGEEIEDQSVIVKLNKLTRNGEKEIAIFSNLPVEVDAIKIAEIYRRRWGIETAFQKLEKHLNSEINTLGYPKAALFCFCTALVAFNLYAVVMAAIRAAHPDINVNDEVSEYYIAREVSTTSTGMEVIVPEEEWRFFINGSPAEVGAALLYLAGNMNLIKFTKNKRGAKKAPVVKDKFKGKPHVSTARLLAEQG